MLSTKEALMITKGRVVLPVKSVVFSDISTDSRNIKKGSLFVPLVGKKYDGHKFIIDALKNGAAGALSSKKVSISDNTKPIILVEDTIKALHKIASYYRNKFKVNFIGITGSSGKTTTKDMLASILSKAGKTLKTEENFNNEIGVPKTIFKLNKKHKYAVIEMAMQGLGEIEELANIVRPNVSIITNVGYSHLQYLKNIKNVAKAKSEILKFQTRKDISILPFDDEHFSFLKKKSKGNIISFGLDSNADVAAENIRYKDSSSVFTLRYKKVKITIELPIPGEHNILDALASAACAFALNIKPAYIVKGLRSFRVSSKRSDIIRKKGLTIINDTYNANPDSMAASLKVLANYPGRKMAILGDMFELGPVAIKSHRQIGILARELGIDKVITVGELMKNANPSIHVKSTSIALKKAKQLLSKGDTVLIKGSRGMHMEDIVKGLLG